MSPACVDGFADVLDERRRAVWDTVAAAALRCGGCLMGGTALALHMRHRSSMDFDIFTVEDFYHPHVVDILRRSGHDYEPYLVRHNSVNVILGGVLVQIHRDAPDPQTPPTQVTPISDAVDICGMPVASLEDAFASKLNAVRHRCTERDLFDVYTVDTATWCKLEDGLRLHRLRYGIDAQDQILGGLAMLLDNHEAGTLGSEGFDISADGLDAAARWLQARLPEVSDVAARARAGSAMPEAARSASATAQPTAPSEPAPSEPAQADRPVTRLTRLLRRLLPVRPRLGGGAAADSASAGQLALGGLAVEPIARCAGKVKKNTRGAVNAACILPHRHRGPHRSVP